MKLGQDFDLTSTSDDGTPGSPLTMTETVTVTAENCEITVGATLSSTSISVAQPSFSTMSPANITLTTIPASYTTPNAYPPLSYPPNFTTISAANSTWATIPEPYETSSAGSTLSYPSYISATFSGNPSSTIPYCSDSTAKIASQCLIGEGGGDGPTTTYFMHSTTTVLVFVTPLPTSSSTSIPTFANDSTISETELSTVFVYSNSTTSTTLTAQEPLPNGIESLQAQTAETTSTSTPTSDSSALNGGTAGNFRLIAFPSSTVAMAQPNDSAVTSSALPAAAYTIPPVALALVSVIGIILAGSVIGWISNSTRKRQSAETEQEDVEVEQKLQKYT